MTAQVHRMAVSFLVAASLPCAARKNLAFSPTSPQTPAAISSARRDKRLGLRGAHATVWVGGPALAPHQKAGHHGSSVAKGGHDACRLTVSTSSRRALGLHRSQASRQATVQPPLEGLDGAQSGGIINQGGEASTSPQRRHAKDGFRASGPSPPAKRFPPSGGCHEDRHRAFRCHPAGRLHF